MANAVFATKVSSVYNDLPEVQYHFPQTYLNAASAAVGDLIVYYEPRRESSLLSGHAGRQCYFAVARVLSVDEDPRAKSFYYAHVADYLEFDQPVPFRDGDNYFESALQKSDGSTNKGSFGRSVRLVPGLEFQAICRAGFTSRLGESSVLEGRVAEDPAPLDRSMKMQLQERTFREASFGRTIQRAYAGTCAMTGLNLTDGEGHREVESAHIKPVADWGPDSPRNGIALSRTVHWMFDRGILSISESGEILTVKKLVPDKIRRVFHEDGKVIFPSDPTLRPHNEFLRFHREFRFKG